MNLLGRDQGSFIDEAQRAVSEKVKLPPVMTSAGAVSLKIARAAKRLRLFR
jgi:cobalt-zinc-cadmium resistance protein CzcA